MSKKSVSRAVSLNAERVKTNPLAVAVLLDIAFHKKRKVSEIIKDLKEDCTPLLESLREAGYIHPNPHMEVSDIKYILAPRGYFLINELKLENPALLKEIEPELVSISN